MAATSTNQPALFIGNIHTMEPSGTAEEERGFEPCPCLTQVDIFNSMVVYFDCSREKNMHKVTFSYSLCVSVMHPSDKGKGMILWRVQGAAKCGIVE